MTAAALSAQTLLWDHADTPSTSFVIRAGTNAATCWSNWPVRSIVHGTNAWKIEPLKPSEFFTCQASNAYGISAPACIATNRPGPSAPRTLTTPQVAAILKQLRAKPEPACPPSP